MKLIRPSNVNNVSLVSSNVTEADYAAYSPATTYAVGERVIVVSPSAAVTISVAAPGVITWASHGLLDGAVGVFSTTGALPTGLTAGVAYYIAKLDDNTFTVSKTPNGYPVVTSGTQSGTHTFTASMHNIYESLSAGNTGNTPRLTPAHWLDMGATNRWKMFDGSVTSQTQNQGSIAIAATVSGRADSVALLNVSAATARFRLRDAQSLTAVTISVASPAVVSEAGHTRVNGDMVALSTTGALPTGLTAGATYYVVNAASGTYQLSATSGGAAINTSGTQSGVHSVALVLYDQTYSLTDDSGITSWYDYFFEPILRVRDIVELEMPSLSTPTFDITLTGSADEMVACGACVIGQRYTIGDTQIGIKTGIQDYSVKTRDDFGNYTVLERAFAKRADFTVTVDKTKVATVQNVLSDYRATPIVYVGTELYENTILYGFYRDFSVDIAYHEVSVCTLALEGLT